MDSGDNTIELQLLISPELSNSPDAASSPKRMKWVVRRTKSFGDEVNFGKLLQELQPSAPIELCWYDQGTIGEPIDISKTPQECSVFPGMFIYVRMKGLRRRAPTAYVLVGRSQLAREQYDALNKLKEMILPSLSADEPCPLCNRTRSVLDMSHSHATASSAAASKNLISPQTHAEVSVQVGNAGRVDAPIDVTFGASARMHDEPFSALKGGSPPRLGALRFETDSNVVELKWRLDEAVRRAEELERRLKESENQRKSLERWKADHRCMLSEEVSQIRVQNTRLQEALRDIARGREEVMTVLVDRRTVGSMVSDVPFSSTPIKYGSPPQSGGGLTVPPAKLLAQHDIATSVARTRAVLSNETYDAGHTPIVDPPPLLSRPSGLTTSQTRDPIDAEERPSFNVLNSSRFANPFPVTHLPGQCLLRVASVSGDPFFVKRRMTSTIREGGEQFFCLMSLDGVLTDSIKVSDTLTCGTDGPSGLLLATRAHSWAMYMAPSERNQWLHWFYALNPFLSAAHPDAAATMSDSA